MNAEKFRTKHNAQSFIGGNWRESEQVHDVLDPYRGDVVGYMPVSGPQELDGALNAARAASQLMAKMPGYARAKLLNSMADSVADRASELAVLMTRESGKAIADSRVEVDRTIGTLRLSAEEAVRIQGDHVPMEASPLGAGKLAFTTRFPVGAVAAITPFNGPLNLAAHKLGPALAAGNSIVLKPSPKAPLCVQAFVEAAAEADIPEGAVNLIFGDEIAPNLVSDPRVDFVSFTGSISVGKLIRKNIGMKGNSLELGGVGPTFVTASADIERAAKGCARGGFLLAGQSCVSVQNVYVHEGIQHDFTRALRREIEAIRFGDPLDERTEVGTLIDSQAASAASAMVTRAVDQGAEVTCGGNVSGAKMDATLLTHVNESMEVVSDEIFGPVVTVQPYLEVEPIYEQISQSAYGLQAGIFTESLDDALSAYRGIRTGGVIVNGTSRWRTDQMPYGGVKDSGIGREGPKFAIRDMTEERLLVIDG